MIPQHRDKRLYVTHTVQFYSAFICPCFNAITFLLPCPSVGKSQSPLGQKLKVTKRTVTKRRKRAIKTWPSANFRPVWPFERWPWVVIITVQVGRTNNLSQPFHHICLLSTYKCGGILPDRSHHYHSRPPLPPTPLRAGLKGRGRLGDSGRGLCLQPRWHGMTVHSHQLNRDIMDPALTVKGEDGGAIPTVTVRLYRGLHAKGPCGPFSFHPKFMTVAKGAMQRDVTATKYIYIYVASLWAGEFCAVWQTEIATNLSSSSLLQTPNNKNTSLHDSHLIQTTQHSFSYDDDELMLNVLRCHETY